MDRSRAGYGRDLAYIHDAGFSGFATAAAPGLLRILRANAIYRGLVVDLGCGPGVWARELTEAGYEVLGIDLSASMIRIARERAPEATFRKGSLFETALPRCDAVTSLGECINYVFERRTQRLRALFSRVHDALREGGVFISDFAVPGRGGGSGTRKSFFEGKDWAVLVEAREDAKRRIHAPHHVISPRGRALSPHRGDAPAPALRERRDRPRASRRGARPAAAPGLRPTALAEGAPGRRRAPRALSARRQERGRSASLRDARAWSIDGCQAYSSVPPLISSISARAIARRRAGQPWLRPRRPSLCATSSLT